MTTIVGPDDDDSRACDSAYADAEEGSHLFVEEAAAGTVGLDPFSVEDELGDGAFAYVGDDLLGGAGDGFDIDFFEGDGMLIEETLGGAAVAAPVGRVNE